MTTKRWSERTRLVLTLALIALPAAALIAVALLHLRSIQRDKSVEAAIQRDFQQMLAISEKRISNRTLEMVDEARNDFPSNSDAASLDSFLASHRYGAHVFLYDHKKGLSFRSQPRRMNEPDFRVESEKLQEMLNGWFAVGESELAEKFEKQAKKDMRQVSFFANMPARGDKYVYSSAAIFPLPKTKDYGTAMGGIVFDAEFLKNEFFPTILDSLVPCPPGETAGDQHNHAVMMVHVAKESTPLAASTEWDGGVPEVERNFDSVFPGLTLAIKFRGTTVEEMGRRFLRTSFLILGSLSLLLAGGIFLAYRSISKEMALAKLKSDFVSNVSHELRTPLSLIRLYAETLEMGRLQTEDKRDEYYRTIRKESERLSALINNILDFSRIEAGRKEYDLRETDLADLVRNTLEAYRYQIEQNGFSFEQNIAADLPRMRVDREAIARSLLNLVNNAVKYSASEKYIGVKVYRSNGSVSLEVVDHGIGIPHGEQNKIFDKFYRVGDPLVHNTKGSGLGLSLVRHIVQAHGGEVSVESAPGHGSKFTITLPVNANVSSAAAGSA